MLAFYEVIKGRFNLIIWLPASASLVIVSAACAER